MCEDAEYAKIDKPSLQRLAWVLMKLNSDKRHETDYFANNFVSKIENAFSSLPKPINWQSFYLHDLKPYLKMDDEVKKVSAEKKLRKSQAKALDTCNSRMGRPLNVRRCGICKDRQAVVAEIGVGADEIG